MKASTELILRQVAGEYILIPTGRLALRIHGMINLTESGAMLWELLQQERTRDELVEAILGEYQIDRETAQTDVSDFVKQMGRLGILEGTDIE